MMTKNNYINNCFIRVCDDELIQYLGNIGYDITSLSPDGECIATTASPILSACNITSYDFDNTNPHRSWDTAARIDCGTNKKLFKALTIICDEMPDFQYFDTPKGIAECIGCGSSVYMDGTYRLKFKSSKYSLSFLSTQIRKLSTNEVVDYFKTLE